MEPRSIGILVVIAGVILVLVGLVISWGGFSWFGRLPGDIRYESERVHVYVPIVSMLLLSLAFSVILYLIRRFF